MIDKEYNLLYEKWIIVLNKKGETESVGLIELFDRAHEFVTLSGEIPAQDMAVMRLLIAILYATYTRGDNFGKLSDLRDDDDAVEFWNRLWIRGHFDSGLIKDYLKCYEERFYLFHPEYPFYQANITGGTYYTASKLNGELLESSNKPRLFSGINGIEKTEMNYSNAARWLIYMNSFDDTASKPLGSNLPSPGTGWLGKLGLVYIHGNNVFETLLLNFVLTDRDYEPFPTGNAVWELSETRVNERVEIPVPKSPVELLTLQSRRLLLKRDKDSVTGYLLIGGDIIARENAFTEQMTAWRLNDKAGVDEWVPKRHNPSRAMWRDFSSLLIKGESDSGKYIKPGVVRWVSELVNHDYLDYSSITIESVGVVYGSKDTIVDDLVNDSISLNKNLLKNIGDVWNTRIGSAVKKTDECVSILGKFAYGLSMTNGINDKKILGAAADRAKSAAYFSMDKFFRVWLSSIDPINDDMETKINSWIKTMEKIVLDYGKQILEDSGEKAFVGRDTSDNSMVKYGRFRSEIYKKTNGRN